MKFATLLVALVAATSAQAGTLPSVHELVITKCKDMGGYFTTDFRNGCNQDALSVNSKTGSIGAADRDGDGVPAVQ
jgi:hypothetical protein